MGTVPGTVPRVIRKAISDATWRAIWMATSGPVFGAIAATILGVTCGGIGEAMRMAFPVVVGEVIAVAIEKTNCEGTREGT